MHTQFLTNYHQLNSQSCTVVYFGQKSCFLGPKKLFRQKVNIHCVRWYLRGDIKDAVGDFCNVWPIIGYSLVGVSYWNLTLISINRNLAMSNPKLATKIFTWKRCAVYHVTLWLIFLAYFMIPLFGLWGEMMYQPKTFRCSIDAKVFIR